MFYMKLFIFNVIEIVFLINIIIYYNLKIMTIE